MGKSSGGGGGSSFPEINSVSRYTPSIALPLEPASRPNNAVEEALARYVVTQALVQPGAVPVPHPFQVFQYGGPQWRRATANPYMTGPTSVLPPAIPGTNGGAGSGYILDPWYSMGGTGEGPSDGGYGGLSDVDGSSYGGGLADLGGIGVDVSGIGGESGGGDSGGGKIICTTMNRLYRLPMRANAIWMKYDRQQRLAPEYALGYHKLFAPLARRMPRSKFWRVTMSWLAKRRTADLEKEMAGSRFTFTQIVLRPTTGVACYLVGKAIKRGWLRKADITDIKRGLPA